MKNEKHGLLTALLILSMLICCGAGDGLAADAVGSDAGPILIRLGMEHFDPLQKYPQTGGMIRFQTAEAGTGEPAYYIVQFDGPIKQAWKEALEDLNAKLFDYVPDFAFIVRAPSNRVNAVRSLPHVRWVGDYLTEYKLSRGVVNQSLTEDAVSEPEMEGEYPALRILIFPGEDVDRIAGEISLLGGTVIRESIRNGWDSSLTIRLPAEKIPQLGAIQGVKWIAPAPKWRLHNNVSANIIAADTTRRIHGLYGDGQTVGICDSGLDVGINDPLYLHKDFLDGKGQSRVVKIFDISGQEKVVPDTDGHGTHVAGSVLGNGARSGSNPASDNYPTTCFSGMAPKARLVFQAQGDTPGDKWPTLTRLFEQAQAAGANLHSNSWGSANGSSYNTESAELDTYAWEHRDFLVLFSAGNSGVDKDGDGVIDFYSLGEPATAKNCLTVGASEGNRPSGCGYDNLWGVAWPQNFSADPIKTDHVSNNPRGIAAFSSRGPVLDGRYKPDLVAPGTNILSTRSSVAEKKGWGIYNQYYMWMGGTSMSTPITAGTAALVREYLNKVVKIPKPSAAILKAAILNGAQNITPGQYGTGSTQEIPDSPVPNNVEGWGRLNLGNTVYPKSPETILYCEEKTALKTDESSDHHFTVNNSSLPLKINLAWTDYPGSEITQGGLVNDLDLQVISPSQKITYPDHAMGKPKFSPLRYNAANFPQDQSSDSMAVRFTPAAYPANVEVITFVYFNPEEILSDVMLVIYADDGQGGLPGTVLFKKKFTYIPSGEGNAQNPATISVGITGVVINQGDFYAAIEKTSAFQYLAVENGDPGNRSYRKTASGWELSGNMAWIFAGVRETTPVTAFDRVNNVLGLTLPDPEPGEYTVRVTGYNVPQGPQTYALVARGGISSQGAQAGDSNFEFQEYKTSEKAGSATIRVLRSAGSTGPLSVGYRTEDGTAKAGIDYGAVHGTLSWADGDQTPKEFVVPILKDNEPEAMETVTLLLETPAEDGWLNSVESAVLDIENSGAGTLDIKANGSDGPIIVDASEAVSITVSLDPGDKAGQTADWFVVAKTSFDWPLDWYTYAYPTGWIPGIAVTVQTVLFDIPSFEVLRMVLPIGVYTFYFAVDDPDRTPTGPWWGMDSVSVTVQ